MKIKMTQEQSQSTQVELPIDEEAREGCCGSCSGESCCSEGDCQTEEPMEMVESEAPALTENELIKSPFSDEFMPMALVVSDLQTYLCGLMDYDNDRVFAHNPLLFQEQLTPEGQLSVFMKLPHMVLGCIPNLLLKYSALYLFRNNRPADMHLAGVYEARYREIRMSESGIVQPTADDLIQIHRG